MADIRLVSGLIIILILLAVTLTGTFTIPVALTFSTNIPPAPSTIPDPATNQTSCDANLTKNIANYGPPRFKIINSCVTITGTITLVHTPSDGDTVFAMKLDKAFESPTMVTKANFNSKMKGGIWIEEICQRKNTSREPVHKGDCSFPQFVKIFKYKPHVGDKVLVTGVFLQDIREGGHTEIHPVSHIEKVAG
jgi:hypothetical protein